MLLGYKEYLHELLLEAKSPEEVVKILSYKHQDIPESVVKKLVETDPTKKKSYAAWVLSVEKNPRKINDYLDSGKLRRIFDYFRKKSSEGASLIDKSSIEEAEKYLPESSNVFAPSEDKRADDYRIGIETDEWIVATPDTYEASEKLGQNTKWCTAGAYGNGEYYYNDYTRSGPLWINFDKRKSETLKGVTYPYKRYQFCFERKAYLDAHDDPFDWEDLDMPDDIQEFYQEQGYDITDLTMSTEERWEEYDNARWNDSVPLFGDAVLMREWDDDMRWDEDDENADYCVYDISNDTQDPIAYSDYYRKDCVVFVNDSKCFAVLKEKGNSDTYSIVIERNTYRGEISIHTGIEKYSILGENGDEYIAFLNMDGTLFYATDDGNFPAPEDKQYDETCDIFLNGTMSNSSDLYIEVSDNYGHSLYLVDYDEAELKEIIINEEPLNGREFQIESDGKIHTENGIYDPHTGYISNDESTSYVAFKHIDNPNLIIGRNRKDLFLFNIFELNNMHKPLLKQDFNRFVTDLSTTRYKAVIIELDGKSALYSLETGGRISDEYLHVEASSNKSVILGTNEVGEKRFGNLFVITGNGDIPIAKLIGYPNSGILPVLMKCSDGKNHFRTINLTTREIGMEWVDNYGSFGFSNLRYVVVSDKSGKCYICDWVDDKILSDNISVLPQPVKLSSAIDKYYIGIISFVDKSKNIFYCDDKEGKFLLNENPVNITKIDGSVDKNIFVMLDYGNEKVISEIDGDYNVKNILTITPGSNSVYSSVSYGHKEIFFTIDNDRNKIFSYDIPSGKLSTYDVNPTVGRYGEIPIEQASPEKQKLASEIFGKHLAKTQTISESVIRIDKNDIKILVNECICRILDTHGGNLTKR